MPVVSGTVSTPAGSPAVGVPVLAHMPDQPRRRAHTHTGGDGAWRLELPPGRWQVREQGHRTYDVQVAADDVALDGPTTAATEPTRDDVARLLARRAGRR